MTLTVHQTTAEIYTAIVASISHRVVVESLLQEQVLRQAYGPLEPSPQLPPAATPQPAQMKQESSVTPSTVPSRNGTPAGEMTTRTAYVRVPGRDVFGNEKVADSARLFECRNCGRKISGNRFAAHVDRCLGGRQRK